MPRLVTALEAAGADVQRRVEGSPALGVGNIGRARGGALAPYSHSHQAGRDCDLAFYLRDEHAPIEPDDLHHVTELRTSSGLRFDTPRNWALVAALLEDRSIDVKWLFVSDELLLRFARSVKAPAASIAAAERTLHQPSDAHPTTPTSISGSAALRTLAAQTEENQTPHFCFMKALVR